MRNKELVSEWEETEERNFGVCAVGSNTQGLFFVLTQLYTG